MFALESVWSLYSLIVDFHHLKFVDSSSITYDVIFIEIPWNPFSPKQLLIYCNLLIMNKISNVNNSSNTTNWNRKKVKVISSTVMQALSTLWWTCSQSSWRTQYVRATFSKSILSFITYYFFLNNLIFHPAWFFFNLKIKKNLPSFIQWCFSFIDLSDLECVF